MVSSSCKEQRCGESILVARGTAMIGALSLGGPALSPPHSQRPVTATPWHNDGNFVFLGRKSDFRHSSRRTASETHFPAFLELQRIPYHFSRSVFCLNVPVVFCCFDCLWLKFNSLQRHIQVHMSSSQILLLIF